MRADLGLFPSYSLYKLRIVDESDYEGANPGEVSMEIIPPGYNKVNVPFTPDSINTYDSESLRISCGTFTTLPDGVYRVKYTVPKFNLFIQKTFLRTEQLFCKYGKVLLSLHMEYDCFDGSSLRKIKDVRLMIDAAIAAANEGNESLAYKLYNKADSILNQLKDCSCV